MIRLFNMHEVRKEIELDGLWEFSKVDEMGIYPERYCYKLPVPGCWEMHPDFLTYRGKAAYRKFIDIQKKQTLRLIFKGVSHTGEIYFDRKKVARHYNAFTQFDVIIPEVEKGTHELVVFVDNTFSEESTLHTPNDYFTYGGIILPVVL